MSKRKKQKKNENKKPKLPEILYVSTDHWEPLFITASSVLNDLRCSPNSKIGKYRLIEETAIDIKFETE